MTVAAAGRANVASPRAGGPIIGVLSLESRWTLPQSEPALVGQSNAWRSWSRRSIGRSGDGGCPPARLRCGRLVRSRPMAGPAPPTADGPLPPTSPALRPRCPAEPRRSRPPHHFLADLPRSSSPSTSCSSLVHRTSLPERSRSPARWHKATLPSRTRYTRGPSTEPPYA